MSFIGAILMILSGLAIMALGLFLFYAWLPFFYGLFGFDIGLLLGRTLTGDVGFVAIILGIAGAIILAAASYFLEPYRRLLLGVSGGVLLGLSLAYVLGIESWLGGLFGLVLAVGGGLIGAVLVPRFFDSFIIGASAFGGAAMVMAGAHLIFPGVELFDRASGTLPPALITLILGVAGMLWQLRNITKWVRSQLTLGDVPGASE